MAREDIFVGVEIGTSKVCVVVAEQRGDGTIKLLGVGQTPSRGVRKGEIIDFDTAHKCVNDALAEAEERSDVEIRTVYVAVTGSHITSFNNRGVVQLAPEGQEITDEHVEEVKLSAKEVSLPAHNVFLHTLIQNFYVDGQDGVLNPLGMLGRRLEADYHIILGVRTRIQNTVRCIKEFGLEVRDVVVNSLASAQVVLTQNDKSLGALVIDIGGGTTDFLAYVDGSIKVSGVLAVGGDHITNDISMGLRLPIAKAEMLKVEEGSANLSTALPGDTITLKDDGNFAGRDIERSTLNTIIHLRLREAFTLVKKEVDAHGLMNFLGAGVFLTGGTALMDGAATLAEEVFGVPVTVAKAKTTSSGMLSPFENPQLSTCIGLIKYAQIVSQDASAGGALGTLARKLKGWLGLAKS